MADGRRLLQIFALAALGVIAAPAFALQLLTEESPPFNYTQDGKLVGSGAEIVAEMARRAKIPVQTQVLPWDQAYVRAQAERETCLFSTARLDNRERLFTWIGPIAINVWAVYAPSSFATKVTSLSDLKPLRIGAVVQDAKAEFLRENGVTNIRALPDDRQNPPRLLLPADNPDHIDLWVAGVYGARELAKSVNVSDLKQVMIVRELPLYLACSPQTGPTTVRALSDALETIKADGTLKRITGDYERRFPQ
jgi:polar amino acid transport system substrate-binding protein